MSNMNGLERKVGIISISSGEIEWSLSCLDHWKRCLYLTITRLGTRIEIRTLLAVCYMSDMKDC